MTGLIFNIDNYFLNPYAIAHILIGIIIALEGIFIFFQNKRSLTNTAYLINCFFPAVWLTGAGLALISRQPELALFWSRFYCFFGIVFIPAAVYLFSVVWKESLLEGGAGRDLNKYAFFSKRKSLLFILFVSLIFYSLSLFSERFLIGVQGHSWGFYPRGGVFLSFFVAWFFLIYILALGNFVLTYKKVPPSLQKKQAKMIVAAFMVAILGAIDFLPKYGVRLRLIGPFPTLLFVSLVGYCVVRYKLMDIETVLHKTVTWFLTNLILVIPFVLILYFTYSWFNFLSNAGILSFLGFLGITFLFFVRGFHAKIDHFFQRRRYGLEEIANQFTEDLVHLKGVIPLSRKIKDVIAHTLYSRQVSLFVYDSKTNKYVSMDELKEQKASIELKNILSQWLAKTNKIIYRETVDIDPLYLPVRQELKEYFDSTGSSVIVPLVLGQELLGLINLDKKANLKRYSASDSHFLTVIKNQSAIAISNSLLYDGMEEQVKKRTEELIETQKQLIQAEKMATVGTLAGGVAHEINNPLTAILTNVQFFLSDPESMDKESLQLIEEATKRCRTIIQKLMLYARKPSESDQMEQINILDVIKDVVGLLGYQFKQENVDIKINSDSDIYLIAGNKNEVEQVITNLILNAKDAIKKIKEEGDIEVLVSKEESKIKVEVKDEGEGIHPRQMTKIFDPFYTTKEIGKGTGLGLSICQSIVRKHQGAIEVKSKPRQGSVFSVIIPAAENVS